ncbi:phage tail assembly protein [Paenibacillus sp. GCM10027626]|uniref:phage tail assembly protein n=1 Tax=Paenibacillus sp. GCM10027626 TaxID=3273411 RepID=UPI0036382627
MRYKLLTPIEFDGVKVEVINLDFESLSGADIVDIDRQFLSGPGIQGGTLYKELYKEYQALVAAAASKHPVDLFLKLKAADFNAVSFRVQRFLLDGDLVGAEETEQASGEQ